MTSKYNTGVSGVFRQAGHNAALSRALPSVGTADQDAPHYFTRNNFDPVGVYTELGPYPKTHDFVSAIGEPNGRLPALICAAAAAGTLISAMHVQQYQGLFCLLTKRKPALVIRAVQLVWQEPIGAIGVRTGAARQASLASGPKERPVAVRALIHHLARYQRPPWRPLSFQTPPISTLALNRRRWPNLAASECLSITAAARLAAWRCWRRWLFHKYTRL
jgi:hypothetical protein